MVLEPGHDWALAPRLEELMPMLSPQMARQMTRETQDAVLELATRPHASAEATGAEAAILRGRLTAELAPLGLRAASAGTHPCAVWHDTRISSGDRHQEEVADDDEQHGGYQGGGVVVFTQARGNIHSRDHYRVDRSGADAVVDYVAKPPHRE